MTVTVALSKSYTSGPDSRTFAEVQLREPTYKEIFLSSIGEPREFQPTQGGAVLLVYPERVDQYLQRICVSPGYEYLHVLNAVDSLRLQNAVCDFFREEPAALRPPMPLSSGSDGTPQE
ncbi:hypothetical protein IB237_23285 [Agrobacterium sp. AGB01]|uniref:hypothetical protein n=1 Tax=Agrobacterium sp. AGB01 TaxID=2769302 RepID=UPI001784D608|nr:hypothetical protein [Agrobacterium sp. AGB01]MBD9390128.1 hypothetical protein [Agrobacterium sp. AGB01]